MSKPFFRHTVSFIFVFISSSFRYTNGQTVDDRSTVDEKELEAFFFSALWGSMYLLNNSILCRMGRHQKDSHCEHVNGSTSYVEVYVPDIISRQGTSIILQTCTRRAHLNVEYLSIMYSNFYNNPTAFFHNVKLSLWCFLCDFLNFQEDIATLTWRLNFLNTSWG